MPVMTRAQKKKMETMDNMTHPQLVRLARAEKLAEESIEMLKERDSELQCEQIMREHYEKQYDRLNEENRANDILIKYAYQQINRLKDEKYALEEENRKARVNLERSIEINGESWEKRDELKKENEKLKEEILDMGTEINNRCADKLLFHRTPNGENCLIIVQ